MSINLDHPFQPGARVAMTSGYSDIVSEHFVDKVYKTGHFTLKGSGQRYRPSSHMSFGENKHVSWTARATGKSSWSRTTIKLWDEHTDKEITDAFNEQKKKDKLQDIRHRIDRLQARNIDMDALCKIEALLSAKKESAA